MAVLLTKKIVGAKKRLAYEIKDCTDGFYCLFEYTAEPACSAELDRVMKITDEVLKHMIVREDEKIIIKICQGGNYHE